MLKTLLCLAALSSGCVIHAVEKTTVRSLGTVESPIQTGEVGAVAIKGRSSESTLTVKAWRRRSCSRNVYRVSEVRVAKEADVDCIDLGGGSGGGGGAVAAVYLVIVLGMGVTGLLTGTATAIELAASTDRVETRAKLNYIKRWNCSEPLTMTAIEVTLPSGTVLRGITDASGKLSLEIPQSEPAKGDALVRIPSHTAESLITYERTAAVASR